MKKLLAISAVLLFAVVATHASASEGFKAQNQIRVSLSKENRKEYKDLINTIKHQVKGLTFATVSEVKSDGSFTLETKKNGRNVTVTTTASTSYTKDGQPANKTAVTAGALVSIKGVWDKATSSIQATVVNVFDKLRAIRVTGTVTGATATTLTVKGNDNVTYTVDVSKANIQGQGSGNVSLIVTGDRVKVVGSRLEGSTSVNAYTVHEIHIKNSPTPTP